MQTLLPILNTLWYDIEFFQRCVFYLLKLAVLDKGNTDKTSSPVNIVVDKCLRCCFWLKIMKK